MGKEPLAIAKFQLSSSLLGVDLKGVLLTGLDLSTTHCPSCYSHDTLEPHCDPESMDEPMRLNRVAKRAMQS